MNTKKTLGMLALVFALSLVISSTASAQCFGGGGFSISIGGGGYYGGGYYGGGSCFPTYPTTCGPVYSYPSSCGPRYYRRSFRRSFRRRCW
ncbi:MAG: hypothetical protein CMJ83_15795 [Planctomycetes bacterium]|nr:hypothetical protein [Planctomycetota bacterium]